MGDAVGQILIVHPASRLGQPTLGYWSTKYIVGAHELVQVTRCCSVVEEVSPIARADFVQQESSELATVHSKVLLHEGDSCPFYCP